jgi:hypothetical protein
MKATPTELRVEETLTLTVRISAVGSWQRPPQRPKLAKLRAFDERFYIQTNDSSKPDRELPRQQAWEFDYRLRPKNTAVKEIPALLFVYYKPGVVPPEKGYRTTDAEPVPLTVKPVAAPPRPIQAPERLFQLAPDTDLLRQGPPLDSSLSLLLLILLAPPALCIAWYAVWSHRYPDAARQARQRRSRAAQKALHALQAVPADAPVSRATRSVLIVTDYLRHRLDLRPAEPTPAEVAHHLQATGFSADLAGKTAEFFRACDTTRFTPGHAVDGADLPATASSLILSLEAESCPSPAS